MPRRPYTGTIYTPRVHPGEVPLYKVPAETIYEADDFSLSALPQGTTAVALRLLDDFPEARRFDDQLTGIRRNAAHVRSFELTRAGQPVIDDVATTLKGGEWTYPELRWEHKPTIEGTLYHGGVQLEDALATLATSQQLDEWGIRGERVQRIDAPKVLAAQHKPVPARKVIDHMIDTLHPEYVGDTDYIFHGSNERLGRFRLGRHLKATDRRPVTMIRTAPTDLRLSDVYSDYSELDKEEIVQSGMEALARANPDYSGMQVTSIPDLHAFFIEALPHSYGVEIGKLTEHGHKQQFPHAGNILLDGGLVDLDGIMPGVNWPDACRHLTDGCEEAMLSFGIDSMPTWTAERHFNRGVKEGRAVVADAQ
jgi:hypothetical protein